MATPSDAQISQTVTVETRDPADMRRQDQIARNHDLFECRYLLGLLGQEWTQAYKSGDAQPSKSRIKHLRKEAKTAEQAVTRLITDLGGAKPPAKPEGSALSAHVPPDFISTLNAVNAELGTFAHSGTIDAVQQRTVIADLWLLKGLLNHL
jgi:hypothetical protein